MRHLKESIIVKSGAALVLTLCALVLITVLVVAFFSKAEQSRRVTFSSTHIVLADQLARSGSQMIIGELRQEIAESSDVLQGDPESPNPGYPPIFRLKDGMSPSPVKIGVGQPDALGAKTIVKVSTAGMGVRSTSSTVASEVSIDTASRNGRRISHGRWFGSGGPVLGSQPELPAWIYMTRSGAGIPDESAAGNPASGDYVTGRIAFTVYDVSGRLDANVAGYPSAAVSEAGTKSSVAYADLSVLGPVFAEGPIDTFVQWRNSSAAYTAKDYEFYLSKVAGPDGFCSTPLQQQRFLSRKDLLSSVDAGILPGMPEWFTHWCYTVVTPSWRPEKDASEMGGLPAFAYRSNADKSGSVNRDLANLRSTTALLAKCYDDTGKSYHERIAPGDTYVRRPFSLAKLAWIGKDGPDLSAITATNAAVAIKDCFGLTWNAGKHRWEYDHGNPGGILTLAQVQASGRQPDFFELLKAGILEGSLGGHPGAVSGGSSEATTGPAGIHFERVSGNKDRHILQIGANIIDQADSNNYPTAIYQNLVDLSSYGCSELFNTVFGIENLPYLQRIGPVSYKLSDETVAGPEDVWLVPELWNPHETTTADPAGFPESPAHLRLVTYGGCKVRVTEENYSTAPKKHETTDTRVTEFAVEFGNDPSSPNLNGVISFVNPRPDSIKPPPFSNPAQLIGYGGSAQPHYEDPSQSTGPRNHLYYRDASLKGKGPSRPLGVWLGEFQRDPRDWDLGGYPLHTVEILPFESSEFQMTFVLEYLDDHEQWRPYTTMARVQEMRPAYYTTNKEQRNGWPRWYMDWGLGHVDPRTDRFSACAGRLNRGGTLKNYEWEQNTSIRTNPSLEQKGGGRGSASFLMPAASAGFSYRNPIEYNAFSTAYLLDDWAQNVPINGSDPHFWYADPDGVVRPGDSRRADYKLSVSGSDGSGDGAMLYQSDVLPDSAQRRRPVILNRPFRSVAELGYVFRDQPFKSLDLWSELSADAGLLDLFSISDTRHTIVAGKVNPAAAPAEVLRSLLSGSLKQNCRPVPGASNAAEANKLIQSEEAVSLADALAADFSDPVAWTDRSSLVERLSPILDKNFAGATQAATLANKANKGWAEAPVRTLSQTTSSRCWNLLIDVVAQTGSVPRGDGLRNFVVHGERRYWTHVTIDRVTGKVVRLQLEPCYD